MSMNNNSNPNRGILGNSSSPFGNASILNSSGIPPNAGLGQSQGQGASAFQNQFQLLQAQARAKAQAQAQAVQGVHPQFQAQLQASLTQMGAIANMGSPSQSLGGTPGSGSGSGSGGGVKQPLQKPPMRPPGVPLVSMMSPIKQMELVAAARKKKQKMQDRVAVILPESALYTQLLEFEARVDAALIRKKTDIQEALKSPPLIQRTMRIYVFNTFADQIRTVPPKPNVEPPTWTLKIIGRILDEGGGEPDQPGAVQKSNPVYPKFSSFFKRITIQLDQRLYPNNPIIVWENSRSSAPQEGFEVKRKGDKEFTAAIRLEMNYVPEKFKLSPPLMEVLGIEVETRPRIITAIWHYVKARKLQNPNDPSFFHCDPPLQKVFGEDKMKFTMVAQKISPHLSPPQPIHLEHKIKLSGNCPVGTACYDVLVDVPIPIQRELSALLANVEKNKEIDTCDEAIFSAIRKIREHRKRRAFFLGFSDSPVEFIDALIESQSKDLKLVAGEAGRSAEKERRSDFFNQPWVEDAVIRYLNRKPPAGSDAPPST